MYFQSSPCNLGSELESAMEDSFEAGLPSLAEEREGEEVGSLGLDIDRARKISLFNKTGSRFVDTSRPGGPFRHSYIDVRVHNPVLTSFFSKGCCTVLKFWNWWQQSRKCSGQHMFIFGF